MCFETVLKICDALHITPDVVLTEENPNLSAKQAELLVELDKMCCATERDCFGTSAGISEVA